MQIGMMKLKLIDICLFLSCYIYDICGDDKISLYLDMISKFNFALRFLNAYDLMRYPGSERHHVVPEQPQ